MTKDDLQRALSRLRETGVSLLVTADDHKSFTKADIRQPLAELIEMAAELRPDDDDTITPVQESLEALVNAINGSGA